MTHEQRGHEHAEDAEQDRQQPAERQPGGHGEPTADRRRASSGRPTATSSSTVIGIGDEGARRRGRSRAAAADRSPPRCRSRLRPRRARARARGPAPPRAPSTRAGVAGGPRHEAGGDLDRGEREPLELLGGRVSGRRSPRRHTPKPFSRRRVSAASAGASRRSARSPTPHTIRRGSTPRSRAISGEPVGQAGVVEARPGTLIVSVEVEPRRARSRRPSAGQVEHVIGEPARPAPPPRAPA